MFIRVKYGENETLLCNPSCAAINLLHSIKRRTGYSDRTIVVDLSDEKGLVQELETHKYDSASNYLASHRTYILVQKQALTPPPEDMDAGGGRGGKAIQYEYIPLLNNCLELFPDYKLQIQPNNTNQKKPARRQFGGKASSPAGIKGVKERKIVSRRR